MGKKLQKKKKPKKWLDVDDWTLLRRGDIIKCRLGPYWLSESGEKIPFGFKGVLRIHEVVYGMGILGYGLGRKVESGIQFLYCGIPFVSDITGTSFRPYRFKKFMTPEKMDKGYLTKKDTN